MDDRAGCSRRWSAELARLQCPLGLSLPHIYISTLHHTLFTLSFALNLCTVPCTSYLHASVPCPLYLLQWLAYSITREIYHICSTCSSLLKTLVLSTPEHRHWVALVRLHLRRHHPCLVPHVRLVPHARLVLLVLDARRQHSA